MIRTLSIGIVLLLGGCGGGCSSVPTPSSETCEGNGHGTISSVDIGRYDGTTFNQYQDGDTIPLVSGGQGSPMFVLNLRVTGDDLGDCLPQRTTEIVRGETVVMESQSLVIRQVLPDTWISGDLLMISYDVVEGEMVTFEVDASGASTFVSTSVSLWVDYMGFLPDAGVVPDAAGPDAGPPDAGL